MPMYTSRARKVRGGRRNNRRRLAPEMRIVRHKPKKGQPIKLYNSGTFPFGRKSGQLFDLQDAALMAADAIHHGVKTLSKSGKMRTGGKFGKLGKLTPATQNPKRHEELKSAKSSNPVNKGKGFNTTATGACITHPRRKVPKWKRQRLSKYKYHAYQTILISRPNRLVNSNNVLKSVRYPVKVPEALNETDVMSMLFMPYSCPLTGTHTTYYQHVNSAGTALTTSGATMGLDGRFDTVQNQCDIARHDINKNVDGVQGEPLVYQGTSGGTTTSAADTQTSASTDNVLTYFDEIAKQTHIDLVFTSSRAFPVRVSVSFVRYIQPAQPYNIPLEDVRQLTNNLNNKGMDYNKFKTEWLHEFTLPALRIGKKPPTYSINKKIITNLMRTNAFNEDLISKTMTDSTQLALGQNIVSRLDEVSDGFISGQYMIKIAYRKVREPQQFTYKHVIEGTRQTEGQGWGFGLAEVELPVLSEQSFDVPVHDGVNDSTGATHPSSKGGAPFIQDQGNEAKASFYMHGKIKSTFGYRHQVENVPSIMTDVSGDNNYKKSQSLNMSPFVQGDNTYGILSQSPDHQTLAQNTPSGP